METENRRPEEQAAVEEQEAAAEAEAEAEGADCAEETAETETAEPDAAEELARVKDQLMRLAAEFENYKKRMKNEQDKLAKYAGESILRDLLPTVDNLERALETANNQAGAQGDAESRLKGLLEGVELTRKSLMATLERFGVTPVESLGHPFNPNEQEAMSMEASTEAPANQVIREFARGYRFKDRMLRPAMVVVSSGPGI